MNATELRIRVLLTLQASLLGMVTANMRAVAVSWNDKDVRVRVVFDETVSAEDAEVASQIESEVISHLPDHNVRCQAEACATPHGKIRINPEEVMVFQRAGVK